MTAETKFSMLVENLAESPGLGVQATGNIQGGAIRVGDTVQVGNDTPGSTVRVDRIMIGSETRQQASPGEEAVLLLTGLTTTNIHTGDRLVPARIEETLWPTEPEEWAELANRVYPLFQKKQIITTSIVLAFLCLLALVPIIFFVLIENDRSQTSTTGLIFFVGFSIFWFLITGLFLYVVIWNLKSSLRGGRVFRAGKSSTMASILNRRHVRNRDKHGESNQYYLQVAFDPSLASPYPGEQQYELAVGEEHYNKLLMANTVTVTYATQDPSVFLIEGE